MKETANPSSVTSTGKLPAWLYKRLVSSPCYTATADTLDGLAVVTVCKQARCPNLNECWNAGTATFMIMGAQCTRNCAFCAVHSNRQPKPLDATEPQRVAQAVKRMGLKYAVVTSVTRDDLPDSGAGHFAATIRAICQANPGCKVEVLTPDFAGQRLAVECVCSTGPTVYNHNLETVERLTGLIRSGADYRRSLKVLEWAKSARNGWTKSGLMVGLGETDEEIFQAMRDLRAVGCDILTIGQYLRPSPKHIRVGRFVVPAAFAEYEQTARGMGFAAAACGPFVRSSYQAAALVGPSSDSC